MLNNKLHFVVVYPSIWAFLAAQWMVKNLPANERDTSLIPGLERSPGEGNGNLLQYSCLENPKDRGAWQATLHGVTKVGHNSVTKQQHTLAHTYFTHFSLAYLPFPQWCVNLEDISPLHSMFTVFSHCFFSNFIIYLMYRILTLRSTTQSLLLWFLPLV